MDPDDVLNELRGFSTPSLANAIETFEVRPRNEGFMNASIRCMFPDLGPAVGYAATATIQAAEPGQGDRSRDLWAHVLGIPGPRFVVVKDLDEPRGVGSLWGEVNANIHQAFGCIGVVTDGCVRDLDEMRALGFHAFAASVGVSHAYVRVVDVGVTVNIGGLEVRPGDLLHADQHGVLSVPAEIVADLPAAVRAVEESERGVIAMFRAPDFSPERFAGVEQD